MDYNVGEIVICFVHANIFRKYIYSYAPPIHPILCCRMGHPQTPIRPIHNLSLPPRPLMLLSICKKMFCFVVYYFCYNIDKHLFHNKHRENLMWKLDPWTSKY